MPKKDLSSEEKIILVNEHDEVIGSCLRSEKPDDVIIRVTAVWIQNSKGDVLLAQRAHHKKVKPGQWSVAAGGTVEYGESYLDNAVKELHEEIGYIVDPVLFRAENKFFLPDENSNSFGMVYLLILDNLNLESLELENAVADVKWFSRKALRDYFSDSNAKEDIIFDKNLKPILDWTHQLRKDGVV